MDLRSEIVNAKYGKFHIYFVGQAGFIIRSSKGTLIGIDLYLSNCVERFDGFKRLMPYILKPDDIDFDYLISTHAHYDHFDIDALPVMHKGKTQLYMTENCIIEAKKIELNFDNICIVKYKDQTILDDVKVDYVFCDHGPSATDAVGLIVEVDDYRIYIAGDTRLRLDKILELKSYGNLDLMIVPINGAYGNLDSTEAAFLANLLQPKIVVPCHYWNFIEHLSNPLVFDNKMKLYNPEIKCVFLRPGEELEMNYNEK